MYLFYIDDSADGHYYTFSAIGIPDNHWRDVFGKIAEFRSKLKADHGIYVRKELHAWKFLSGRGRPSREFLSLEKRAEIFNQCLLFLVSLKPYEIMLFNVALKNQDWAFERLLNRINRTMEKIDQRALLICDEGKDSTYTAMVRRMGAYNPIPSKFGGWRYEGASSKSIPIDRIIEDPVFKPSHRSTLIQLADFCAFSLLRHDLPTDRMKALGVHESFKLLEPICFKAANPKDQYGVVR